LIWPDNQEENARAARWTSNVRETHQTRSALVVAHRDVALVSCARHSWCFLTISDLRRHPPARQGSGGASAFCRCYTSLGFAPLRLANFFGGGPKVIGVDAPAP